jgi:hypothetical protein
MFVSHYASIHPLYILRTCLKTSSVHLHTWADLPDIIGAESEKIKILVTAGNRTAAAQPVASHFTD